MDILYISQSPLQLINNIEAYLELEESQGKHLIFIRDQQSMESLNTIIEIFKLQNVQKISITKWFKIFFPLILRQQAKWQYTKIYFGNTTSYTSFLINQNKPKNLVHVDDGTRTLQLLKLNAKSNFFKKPIFKFLSKTYLNNSVFFTYYDQQANSLNRPYIKNSLSMVSKYILQLDRLQHLVPAQTGQKIFIGTNILQTYKNIEDVFAQINTQIGLKDSIYLMHRYDDELLMQKLAQRYDFQVMKINLPIELYFGYLWQKNQPSVWTFGSTAIDTLTLIHPSTKFNVIKLNTNKFTKPILKRNFNDLYTHFSTYSMVAFHDVNSN